MSALYILPVVFTLFIKFTAVYVSLEDVTFSVTDDLLLLLFSKALFYIIIPKFVPVNVSIKLYGVYTD